MASALEFAGPLASALDFAEFPDRQFPEFADRQFPEQQFAPEKRAAFRSFSLGRLIVDWKGSMLLSGLGTDGSIALPTSSQLQSTQVGQVAQVGTGTWALKLPMDCR